MLGSVPVGHTDKAQGPKSGRTDVILPAPLRDGKRVVMAEPFPSPSSSVADLPTSRNGT